MLTAKNGKDAKKGKGGYLFARPPEQINVYEILVAVEGHAIFDDCFMRHCDCSGTSENCDIYHIWSEATYRIKEYLTHMSLVDATWSHPEHYFKTSPTDKTAAINKKGQMYTSTPKT